jgi:predicted enzyme related to lactoylglutathione lyase
MSQPVCHFEIIGKDPENLRRYYREMFGWEFDVGDAATEEVSEPGQYGFVGGDLAGINGGVCGGRDFEPRVLVYVNVPNVEAALANAERLGGTRRLGPVGTAGSLVVGQFVDPEGNVVGVAGPE